MKKKILPVLLALLLPLLCACSQTAESAAEPQETETAESPAPTQDAAQAPDEEPGALELRYRAPAPEGSPYACRFSFSGQEELDCAFCYPELCDIWVEDGVIRLSPGSYFARVFLSCMDRDDEKAPDSLLGLLETAKWGATANETSVGGRYQALRMSVWKYDTYRRWIVWETDERYYTLYASCFDRYADNTNAILDTIASSFVAGGDTVRADAAPGELLRRKDGLSLFFEEARLEGGEDTLTLCLTLRAENASAETAVLTADENSCVLQSGESALWPIRLSLPAQGSCSVSASLAGRPVEGFALDLLIKES